jgi:prepilin-type N-terminal cleavage/methylation domain-containing protein
LLHHFTPRNDGKTGFTLAEVLITLLIIGVVASLVIPALINDTQQQEFITAYKKAFADVSQAFLLTKNNYEFNQNGSIANVVSNIRSLKNYFNVTKSCTSSITQGCWVDNCSVGDIDCFWVTSSIVQGGGEGFIDNAGRAWVHYRSDSTYFIMLVDINGAKLPNRMGRDRFPLFFNDENSKQNENAPIKVLPYPWGDITTAGTNCIFGNCFYRSWLIQ